MKRSIVIALGLVAACRSGLWTNTDLATADLAGADLAGADLSNEDLASRDLSRADLAMRVGAPCPATPLSGSACTVEETWCYYPPNGPFLESWSCECLSGLWRCLLDTPFLLSFEDCGPTPPAANQGCAARVPGCFYCSDGTVQVQCACEVASNPTCFRTGACGD